MGHVRKVRVVWGGGGCSDGCTLPAVNGQRDCFCRRTGPLVPAPPAVARAEPTRPKTLPNGQRGGRGRRVEWRVLRPGGGAGGCCGAEGVVASDAGRVWL